MGLDGEGEQAARIQDTSDSARDRSEIEQVDEDVGGDDEIVTPVRGPLGGEKFQELAGLQPVVDALGPRLGDHSGRQVDAGQVPHLLPERRAGKPGSAAEIEHRAEPGGG